MPANPNPQPGADAVKEAVAAGYVAVSKLAPLRRYGEDAVWRPAVAVSDTISDMLAAMEAQMRALAQARREAEALRRERDEAQSVVDLVHIWAWREGVTDRERVSVIKHIPTIADMECRRAAALTREAEGGR